MATGEMPVPPLMILSAFSVCHDNLFVVKNSSYSFDYTQICYILMYMGREKIATSMLLGLGLLPSEPKGRCLCA